MTSTIFSRLLASNAGEPSIYQTLRQHEDSFRTPSETSYPGVVHGTEESFHDSDLEVGARSEQPLHLETQTSTLLDDFRADSEIDRAKGRQNLEMQDDDVPPSLLIEDEENALPRRRPEQTSPQNARNILPISQMPRGHEINGCRAQNGRAIPPATASRAFVEKPFASQDPKSRAAWVWVNVENLDRFLDELYEYYTGHGLWSILLSRALRLITLAFIVAFSTFLTSCINYSQVPGSKSISEALIPKCASKMSRSTNMLLWLFTFLWIFKTFDYARDYRRLRRIQDFFVYLLEIRESDMQTISWQEIVKRLMNLRDLNPATVQTLSDNQRKFLGTQSKQRMDAHDIANRLMRRENYFIALINKDILDFTLPIPFIRNKQLYSRTLEWNLQYCILDFVFNRQGQVRSLFLRDTHRKSLSEGFKNRFLFAGFISLVCAPSAILYYMLYFFFRYFTEFQRNPSQIGSRQYTPYAEWKFREFNELYHLFERRMKMSYPYASRYLEQFPKDKTAQVSGFVAFVAGALASVLAVGSLIDPESLLAFEITPERTVLFYLGLFGSIWAIARASVPEEHLVFDPEFALNNVIECTHYMPQHWKGRLHTNEIRAEFAGFYQLKLSIFLEELLSIILTPFILWFALPKCSDRLVDFFREFTVHIDGIGYVCSFAVFDFKKGASDAPQLGQAATNDIREAYYSTKDGKMLASYYGFIDSYVNQTQGGRPLPMLHSTRRAFHAPPNFPELTTLTSPTSSRPQQTRARPGFKQPGPIPMRSESGKGMRGLDKRLSPRITRALVHDDASSPLASVLLDPDHQPSPASLARSKSRSSTPRSFPKMTSLTGPLEDDEDAMDQVTAENGDAVNLDGSLDDSWKSTRGSKQQHDASEDDVEPQNDQGGPGVLGLVYQLSRTHSEGRTALNI